MKKLTKLLILLLVLTTNACKTIEYIYPVYPYPEIPKSIYLESDSLKAIMKNMTVEQKKLFALFLQDVDDKQLEWENWAKQVIAMTTHIEVIDE